MYVLYSVLLAFGFFLSLPYYLWKGRASGKYLASFGERMGRLPAGLAAGGPSIWIHAVSVGEVLAARALVEPLRQRFPRHRVLLSTTTLTGNAVARRSLSGLDGLFYAPFDLRRPVRRVLDEIRPALLVIAETELWPNLIHEAHLRGVRVAVVNGRISPRSFRRYLRIRPFMRPVLGEVDLFLMQAEAHARRIVEMGAPPERVKAVGNLKYDAVGDARTEEPLAALLAVPGARPVWVAGSTVAGEEAAVLAAYLSVLERVPGTRLVIAPRHPERFPEVPPLVAAAGLRCARRSALPPPGWAEGEVLLLDSIGELAQLYPLASVVFVGGSLAPAGGHNVLEPAAAGKAVVVGPHMENFQEIADEFLREGALLQLRSADELGEAVASLLLDEGRRRELGGRARALVDRNRGAVGRTVEQLAGLLA